MEIQVFGLRESSDTPNTLRFLAKRRVPTHFVVDLQHCATSPGDLRLFPGKSGVSGGAR